MGLQTEKGIFDAFINSSELEYFGPAIAISAQRPRHRRLERNLYFLTRDRVAKHVTEKIAESSGCEACEDFALALLLPPQVTAFSRFCRKMPRLRQMTGISLQPRDGPFILLTCERI